MSNNNNSEKLVALVIGATGSIGSEVALNFARRGYSVVIHGRNQQKLNALEEKIKALKAPVLKYAFDIRDYKSVAASVADASQKFNGIDILVCAQGHFSTHLLEGDSISGNLLLLLFHYHYWGIIIQKNYQ